MTVKDSNWYVLLLCAEHHRNRYMKRIIVNNIIFFSGAGKGLCGGKEPFRSGKAFRKPE